MSEKKAAAVGLTDAERHGGKDVVDYGEDGESFSLFYLKDDDITC